jgi:hypothetical protein
VRGWWNPSGACRAISDAGGIVPTRVALPYGELARFDRRWDSGCRLRRRSRVARWCHEWIVVLGAADGGVGRASTGGRDRAACEARGRVLGFIGEAAPSTKRPGCVVLLRHNRPASSLGGSVGSSKLFGGASNQSVQVIELTSDASAARYAAKVQPLLARSGGEGLPSPLSRACSYRNLIVSVDGVKPAASAATLGRIVGALETTAPRSTTTGLAPGECRQTLHF